MKGKKDSKTKDKGMNRRSFLKTTGGVVAAAAAGSSLPLFNINHAWAKDVYYDGGTFDAGGAPFVLAGWPGFWEEQEWKILLKQFEKDFNCKIKYESSWPWFPKYVASGPKNPPYAITNWNLTELFKTAKAGDFFLPQEELIANVPNAKDCWPFAFENKIGVTWAFGQYCYVYRTDLVDPAPAKFEDLWQERFADKRATYITSNTLFMLFFIVSCYVFGGDENNLEAGFKAMKELVPVKIVDFTGNMQQMIERGEISIGVQWEGEVYLQMDKGIKVNQYIWTEKKGILTQNKTISRYLEPMQKKLAFAMVNRFLSPEYLRDFGGPFYLRPSNKKAELAKTLSDKGVKNTADALEGLYIPDWYAYLEHEDEVVEKVNEIFSK